MTIKHTTLISTLVGAWLLSGSALANSPAADNAQAQDTSNEQGFMSEAKQEVGDIGTISWIKAKYAQDDLLSVFDISVAAEGNTVTLSGDIETDLQFEKALMIAYQAEGVENVIAEDLNVAKSETPKADLNITAAAKSRLHALDAFANQEPGEWTFQVETKNKVLYVSGQVANEETRDQILTTLESVPGATSIEADLQIQ